MSILIQAAPIMMVGCRVRRGCSFCQSLNMQNSITSSIVIIVGAISKAKVLICGRSPGRFGLEFWLRGERDFICCTWPHKPCRSDFTPTMIDFSTAIRRRHPAEASQFATEFHTVKIHVGAQHVSPLLMTFLITNRNHRITTPSLQFNTNAARMTGFNETILEHLW